MKYRFNHKLNYLEDDAFVFIEGEHIFLVSKGKSGRLNDEERIRKAIAERLYPDYTPEEQLTLLELHFMDIKTEHIPFEGIIEL